MICFIPVSIVCRSSIFDMRSWNVPVANVSLATHAKSWWLSAAWLKPCASCVEMTTWLNCGGSPCWKASYGGP